MKKKKQKQRVKKEKTKKEDTVSNVLNKLMPDFTSIKGKGFEDEKLSTDDKMNQLFGKQKEKKKKDKKPTKDFNVEGALNNMLKK